MKKLPILVVILSLNLSAAETKFTWSNDAFTFQKSGAVKGELSDDNYTNGFLLEYKDGATEYFAGQDIYTPTILIVDFEVKSDRPYAGHLFGGMRKNKGCYVDEFAAGVVGPASGASFVQTKWHEQTHDIPPCGWANQIENTPSLQYKKEYLWRADKLCLSGFGEAGTVFVDAGCGAKINQRIKKMEFGAGYEYKHVAHNLLLGEYVEKKDFVGETAVVISFGAEVVYGFEFVAQSQEFDGQVGDGNKYGGHKFGRVSAAKRF